MAFIKNTRENDFTIALADHPEQITIPGTAQGKEPVPVMVDDAVLEKAMQREVIRAWFENGDLELTDGKPAAAKKDQKDKK